VQEGGFVTVEYIHEESRVVATTLTYIGWESP
jgi:hypothetical protein